MIVIIDYGSGNLRSVAKAVERIAGERTVEIVRSPQALEGAGHIILPGVGAFADCMRGLRSLSGMITALEQEVLQRKKPMLGICVGMQLLFEKGHEHGTHDGLGWLKGEVVSLVTSEKEENNPLLTTNHSPLKVPHMGWNELSINQKHPLMKDIENGAHAYFVHSYHAECKSPQDVIATTQYGQTINAVVGQGNVMGTQFHPEKSQETGLRLLKNFISM